MDKIFYLYLFLFGTLFGSFGSVLVYRLKSQEKGILAGRSHCSKCGHNLGIFELIPIFSWLKNMGKCRYCKQKVSKIYPILEISTGLVFMFVGIFLINFEKILFLDVWEIGKLIFWLIISFITILYIFYDILFTEIHEGIMLVGIVTAFLGIILNNFGEINNLIINTKNLSTNEFFISLLLGLSILGVFYIIMLKGLKEIYDFLILFIIFISLYLYKIYFPETNLSENTILSGIIGALGIFIFFFLQIVFSGGRALGGGDLRIGIMIGLILGMKFSIIGIFLGYFVGSIVGIFILIKNKRIKKGTEIPFGPFLGIGFFITIFFYQSLLEFTRNHFPFL
ncbi:hypothetical protein DLH72_00590 [Candidatus Gracilibacteria bacterium]|nr:MAG: hypothetical protein DLH72_00590 [Candidatus Gracilibacteria bacterium]